MLFWVRSYRFTSKDVHPVWLCAWTNNARLAVRATVNILDWKLVLKIELSVGCLQQPTAITSSHNA